MGNGLNAQYELFLVENVLEPFYKKRLDKIAELQLHVILRAKNPYLFKAKNLETTSDFVKSILDAYLSSQEETIFGNLLEGFAIHVSSILYGGFKSDYKSVDLEFERRGTYHIVGIKSGTNWGNADQIRAMKDAFKLARQALRENGINGDIVAVNGCMYGTDSNPLKDSNRRGEKEDADKIYYKYAGQDFWEFISEDGELYQNLIVPIGREAAKRNEEFSDAYVRKFNQLVREFDNEFVKPDNAINWSKLLDFVSKRKANTQYVLF